MSNLDVSNLHATHNAMLVAICVATYKRPESLRRLLKSLRTIATDGLNVQLLIVENDPAGPSRDLVESLAKHFPFPVLYAVEPVRGIASARNRLVAEAICIGADFVAFVDDDEVVDRFWLQHLVQTATTFRADAVVGPVPLVLEDDAPDWLRQSGSTFRSGSAATGTVVRYGGTGNVLFRVQALRRLEGPFDVRLNLSGGEDTLLFERFYDHGFLSVWCDEALAYEYWPTTRTTVRYILQRHYRDGVVLAKITLWSNPSFSKIALRLAKSVGHLARGALLLIPAIPQGRAGIVPKTARMALGLGGLIGMVGRIERIQEYQRTHGR